VLFSRKNLSVKISNADEPHDNCPSRLYLVRSKDHTGQNAYYFMLLDREKISEFKQVALSSESFDLKDYGDIVASGYGDTVPESLRIRMRVEHGWA